MRDGGGAAMVGANAGGVKEAANWGGLLLILFRGLSGIALWAGRSRGSGRTWRSCHTVLTGWTGRPRWSRRTLKTSCESDCSHA